jgi:hypothetical protein
MFKQVGHPGFDRTADGLALNYPKQAIGAGAAHRRRQ